MQTVQLYGKVAAGRVALVDDEDYGLVARYRWNVIETETSAGVTCAYAVTRMHRADGARGHVLMHNLIMGIIGVDHFNHNGLDNQKENLRPATATENLGNKRRRRSGSSRYKGVTWSKQRKRWIAQIRRDGKVRHLGLFDSEADAGYAYDAGAREVFGPFACLNFPEPGESSADGAGNLEATAATPGTERLPAAGASPYLGAIWANGKNKWQARITSGGKQHHLGFYASDIEAALAYDAAAPEIFGGKAYLNFPDGLPPELADLMRAQQEAGGVAAAARLEGANAGRSRWWSEREPVTRTCEFCEREFETNAVQREVRYCSRSCVDKARTRRRQEERAANSQEVVLQAGICQECGAEYTFTTGRSLYCSGKCKTRAFRARKKAGAA